MFLRDSVTAFLQEYCLIHQYELPPNTTVYSVLEQTARAMQLSQMNYLFQNSAREANFLPHEVFPLQVLGLVARGRNSNGVRLRTMPITTQITLQELAADRATYATPQCIEGDRLVIHCSKLLSFPYMSDDYLIINFIAIRDPLVRFSKDGRLHRCLSARFFNLFAGDGMASRMIDPDDGMTSGGKEEDDTDSDSDMREVTATLAQAAAPPPAPRYNLVSSPALFGLSLSCLWQDTYLV
jgi:hypothetical protein